MKMIAMRRHDHRLPLLIILDPVGRHGHRLWVLEIPGLISGDVKMVTVADHLRLMVKVVMALPKPV